MYGSESSTHAKTQVNSGTLVDLIEPKRCSIFIEDIAHHLSMICRFNGGTRFFYSVAQHSLLVDSVIKAEGHCDHTQLWALLHDASEAYIGDITTPVIQALGMWGGVDVEALKARMDGVIMDKFFIDRDLVNFDAIKQADARILATEKRDVLSNPDVSWGWDMPEPYNFTIGGLLDIEEIRGAFFGRFLELQRAVNWK